jgi:uncharacterized protein (TIGR03083 family)
LQPDILEMMMHLPEPILVPHLFPETLDALIQFLRRLSPEEWSRPTVCADWRVREVALHLLAVEISNVSRKRDGYSVEPKEPIRSDQDLLEFIDFLNESWLDAAQRISTPLLIDLIAFVGKQANDFFASVDPFELGEPVSWAGPEPAPKWLDLAREYTERWHHQQHIRDAVGIPGLKEPRFFHPILDSFVRAMPYTYRDITAPESTCVTLNIHGDSGGQWTIQQEDKRWQLYVGAKQSPDAAVTIDQEDAWRLFTKGIDLAQVRDRSSLTGDENLGEKIFEMVSIIA